jgi:hypothetical protein
MTLFDLVFIVAFVITLAGLVRSLYLAIRRRRDEATRALRRVVFFVGAYLGVVVLVSLLSPRHVVAVLEPQCFDDWCLTVDGIERVKTLGSGSGATTANGVFYVVGLRVSSRARRVTQRENGVGVYLLDDRGRRYDVSPLGQRAYVSAHGTMPSLSDPVGPGAAFTTTRIFDCPEDATEIGLALSHGFGPGAFVIADSGSFFHKRTTVRLAAVP